MSLSNITNGLQNLNVILSVPIVNQGTESLTGAAIASLNVASTQINGSSFTVSVGNSTIDGQEKLFVQPTGVSGVIAFASGKLLTLSGAKTSATFTAAAGGYLRVIWSSTAASWMVIGNSTGVSFS